jgi:hypothetical protein
MTTPNSGVLFLHHGRTVKLISEDVDNVGTVKQCVDNICNAADENIAEFIAKALNLYEQSKRQKRVKVVKIRG